MLALAGCGDEVEKPVAAASSPPLAKAAKPADKPAAAPAQAAEKQALPSAAALERLKDQLIIPVKGASARDLIDTYNQARGERRHAATDILAARGTPVLSATGGRLIQMSSSKTGGLMIFAVDDSRHFLLLYAHLDRYADDLKVGMNLERGQVLGEVGTTGNAPPDTPHLHFAISYTAGPLRWSQAITIDPRPLLLP